MASHQETVQKIFEENSVDDVRMNLVLGELKKQELELKFLESKLTTLTQYFTDYRDTVHLILDEYKAQYLGSDSQKRKER